MPNFSEDRQTILRQLQDAELAATKLIRGYSRQQLNWQPDDGRCWSVCQCLDHLARTNQIYSQAMLQAVAQKSANATGTTAAAPGWFGRWFIGQMEPRSRSRFKAAKTVMPGADGDPEDILQSFVDSHSELRRVLDSWEKVDFNRIRFRSPFAPVLRFTVATGIMIINANDRRHLEQARRSTQSKNFPDA